jgi:hypothetical protein
LHFAIGSRTIHINAESISKKRRERALFSTDFRRVHNQLHDLIAASLGGLHLHTAYKLSQSSAVPLTESRYDRQDIMDQGAEFLGAFENTNCMALTICVYANSRHSLAEWEVKADNIPHPLKSLIIGITENSRNPGVAVRYLRFRFPHVWFEWNICSPYLPITEVTTNTSKQIKFIWKAWAREGAAAGKKVPNGCNEGNDLRCI